MWDLAKRLFPICRSITGQGVRDTLEILKEHIPLTIHAVPSGTRAFDWTVPDEWNITDGYLVTPVHYGGRKIANFQRNNLHVMGYSTPVDMEISLEKLQAHLHSRPDMPDAIPYRTSYYNRDWGFCLTHRELEALPEGNYRAVIKSTLAAGYLNYGELIIPGALEKEVFLSTYICHPSMANDQLSGPVVMTFLVKWLMSKPRRYTYRIVFAPETIGSIVYLSRNLDVLQDRVIAGFNIACMGNGGYSVVHTRNADTLADRVAEHVLRDEIYNDMDFLERGGDERQYCSPGVDLPFVALWRNVNYPQYHTSLDDMSYIKPERLEESLTWVKRCIEVLEFNRHYSVTMCCEPQMGKRGLYRAIGTESLDSAVRTRMNVLAYCDGRSALDIANVVDRPLWELVGYFNELEAAGLIEGHDD